MQTEANNLDRNAVATGVASFLEDALNSKSANKHLRRANMLVMGKQVTSRLRTLCKCVDASRVMKTCPPIEINGWPDETECPNVTP